MALSGGLQQSLCCELDISSVATVYLTQPVGLIYQSQMHKPDLILVGCSKGLLPGPGQIQVCRDFPESKASGTKGTEGMGVSEHIHEKAFATSCLPRSCWPLINDVHVK